MLDGLTNSVPEELFGSWPDGRIKLFLITRVLHFRREHPELFLHGNYEPLVVTGTHAESVLAFAREHDGERIVVIAPRLSSRVGFPAIGERWQDTSVQLPNGQSARDLFTGREVTGTVALRDALVQL